MRKKVGKWKKSEEPTFIFDFPIDVEPFEKAQR
jgi:lysyl-tRNA synthetase class II